MGVQTGNSNPHIGNTIRRIRKELGLSMEAFGQKIRPPASKGAVSNWENGYNLPNSSRLKDIATLGKISVNDLLTNDQNTSVNYPGAALKKLRADNNMTQKKLSTLSGKSIKMIAAHESGLLPLSNNDLKTYATIFKMTDNQLREKMVDYNFKQVEPTLTAETFGQLITERRTEKTLTIANLAKKVQTTSEKLKKIEAGLLNDVPPQLIHDLSALLNISPRYAFKLLETTETYEQYEERQSLIEDIHSIISELDYSDIKDLYTQVLPLNKFI